MGQKGVGGIECRYLIEVFHVKSLSPLAKDDILYFLHPGGFECRYSIEVLHVKSLSPLAKDDILYFLHLLLT